VRRGGPDRATGGINVHDVGALVGQQHGGEGASDVLAKINHANTCQYAGHVFSPVTMLASVGHQTTSQAASSWRYLRKIAGLCLRHFARMGGQKSPGPGG